MANNESVRKDPAALVAIRTQDDVVVRRPLGEVDWASFPDAIPWRRFQSYRGQGHYSGLYWSATMGDHVPYESRLELEALVLADFDPAITWIRSQPFRLESAEASTKQTHVPDYLFRFADDRLSVVDVKPQGRLAKPKVAAQFEWTRHLVEARGWGYQIESEHDSVKVKNVKFLAGYRRGLQFEPSQIEKSVEVLIAPMSFMHAVRTVASSTGDADHARGLVLHMLWRGLLKADLDEMLQGTSLVRPS